MSIAQKPLFYKGFLSIKIYCDILWVMLIFLSYGAYKSGGVIAERKGFAAQISWY